MFQKKISDKGGLMTNKQNATWQTLMLNIILMISLAVAGTQIGWFIPVALIAAMAIPFLVYRTSQDVVRCTFINATIFSIGLLVRYIGIVDLSTPVALVSSLVMLFGVHSAVTLFTCVMNYFTHKIFSRNVVENSEE